MSLEQNYQTEHILIDIIQHYPYLYDKSHQDYKNNNKKAGAWEAISLAMNLSVAEVQRVWKLLRDRYKERRLLKNVPSGSQALEGTLWPLYHFMTFFEKHIQTRKRVSNVTSRSSNSCSSAPTNTVATPLNSPSEQIYDSVSQITTVSEDIGTPVDEEHQEDFTVDIVDDGLSGNEHSEQHNKKTAEKPKIYKERKHTDNTRPIIESLSAITDFLEGKKSKCQTISVWHLVTMLA